MVGVAIDTMQQINSYLLNRHYDGLMKTGSKTVNYSSSNGKTTSNRTRRQTITEALSNAMFRVELENAHVVTAHISGKDAYALYKIAYQEIKLKLEMSPYDLSKARITYRY